MPKHIAAHVPDGGFVYGNGFAVDNRAVEQIQPQGVGAVSIEHHL